MEENHVQSTKNSLVNPNTIRDAKMSAIASAIP